MKGKTDKDGALWIERASVMKKQLCPYDPGTAVCGDWCPLFGIIKQTPEYTFVELCNKKLLFDEFTDERPWP